ncbi:Arc family DNA-binding protein [Pseudomonas sp. p99-361]|uniref:Arc family DNA-binding protein n=1 Tax=Pseudomonas sp. p99-361 TaxID=2479852 RepID=UPI000F7AA090|nr:Arc family DNA-binding protein [Pseudomonas sp. p99-361]RRV53360.1 Arc family DNA-binding protein [Pseudomonas sp. p99-361]
MKDRHQIAPYSLRIGDDLKEKARNEAHANRRSLNAEIGLLIEEGLKWREMQSKQAAA